MRSFHGEFSFADQISVKTYFLNQLIVPSPLDHCPQGDTNTWYSQEVDHLQRIGLQGGEGVDIWCEFLGNRSKMSLNETICRYERESHTISDAYDRRDPAELDLLFQFPHNI